MAYTNAEVLTNFEVADDIFRMRVPWGEAPKAGQFYMLRIPGQSVLLPRPISVHDWADGVLTFLYQVVGEGTKALSALRPGDSLCLTGPLGNGFELDLPEKTALVAGGIGTAPMLYLAKAIKARMGFSPDIHLGFRDEPYLLEEFEPWANTLSVATESGAYGAKGFVTGLYQPEDYGVVICCGPHAMMKAVTAGCLEAGTNIYVSLENKMACGIGACLVCTCGKKDGKYVRTCKDGPVFRGEEIDFDA